MCGSGLSTPARFPVVRCLARPPGDFANSIGGKTKAVARQSFKRGQDDVYVEDPVSCGLMSGLRRGIRRWPSWVSACVSGANLKSVLKAHSHERHRLKLPRL